MTRETLRANIIKLCRAELGETEHPPKSNKTKYGAWYGLDGVYWCCIFICWILDSAGISDMSQIKGYRKGFSHTDHIMRYAKKYALFTNNPKPGDIALVDFKLDRWVDHIGIFERFKKDTRKPYLYEGNTTKANDKESQANGGEVCYKLREEHQITCYISIDKLIDHALKNMTR